MKEPWDGSILCRMTYCEEHPTRKMLLVAVEPAEPNPHCYVCSKGSSLLYETGDDLEDMATHYASLLNKVPNYPVVLNLFLQLFSC
jgi:hypothetical protein